MPKCAEEERISSMGVLGGAWRKNPSPPVSGLGIGLVSGVDIVHVESTSIDIPSLPIHEVVMSVENAMSAVRFLVSKVSAKDEGGGVDSS